MAVGRLYHGISYTATVCFLWRLALLLTVAHAFQCHSCSFSYDPKKPEADNACVDQPEVFTGHQLLKCEHNCVVQETYNQRLDKVVAYWRSCIEEDYAGHCRGDGVYGLITCVYTCAGDLCNSWVRGQLHEVYASDVENSYRAGQTNSHNGSGRAGSSSQSFYSSAIVLTLTLTMWSSFLKNLFCS